MDHSHILSFGHSHLATCFGNTDVKPFRSFVRAWKLRELLHLPLTSGRFILVFTACVSNDQSYSSRTSIKYTVQSGIHQSYGRFASVSAVASRDSRQVSST